MSTNDAPKGPNLLQQILKTLGRSDNQTNKPEYIKPENTASDREQTNSMAQKKPTTPKENDIRDLRSVDGSFKGSRKGSYIRNIPPSSEDTNSNKKTQENSYNNSLNDKKGAKASKNSEKSSDIDIDHELSIISQEKSFIDPEQSKNKKDDLLELGPDGKFRIPNKRLSTVQKKERYKEITFNSDNSNDQIICLVCLDGDAFENDDIFLCDLCNSAFHQSCHGSELVGISTEELDEDTEWFCQRCTYLLNNDFPFYSARCMFCPEMKGPMKKVKKHSDKHWAHINCVNWIPEIYYIDGQAKENVKIKEYIENNHAGRNKLTCCFCKMQYGDCIQCDAKGCNKTFHVTCAHFHGLVGHWEVMTPEKREGGEEFVPIYCKEHIKVRRPGMIKSVLRGYHFTRFVGIFQYIRDEKFEAAGLDPNKITKLSIDKIPERSPAKKNEMSIEDKQKDLKKKKTPQKRSQLKIDSDDEEEKKDTIKGVDTPQNYSSMKSDTGSSAHGEIAKRPAKKSVIVKPSSNKVTAEEKSRISKNKEPKDEEKPQKLYKFRPELAKVFGFYEWATEREMKEQIQKYITVHRLYNSEKREVEVYKDPMLENVIIIQTIPKEHIFKKFVPFMYEKLVDDKKDPQNLPFIALYQEEVKKLNANKAQNTNNETSKQAKSTNNPKQGPDRKLQKPTIDAKIDRDQTNDTEQGGNNASKKLPQKDNSNVTTKNSNKTGALYDPFSAATEEYDPLNWRKDSTNSSKEQKKLTIIQNKNQEDIKNNENTPASLNTKRCCIFERDMNSLFNLLHKGDDTYISKKIKPNPTLNLQTANETSSKDTFSFLSGLIRSSSETKQGLGTLIKGDQMPFRKNMDWFTKTEETLEDTDSINSNKVTRLLWPKGAEIMF